MGTEYRFLFLEDRPEDVELIRHEFRKEGLAHCVKVVSTEKDFVRELDEFKPDVILGDYSIPGFGGMKALSIAQERAKSIPFIMVTGSVSEEVAVECMKAGAADYVIKKHIVRIGPAIKVALERHRLQLQKEKADEELQRLALIVKHAEQSIASLTPDGIVLSWNRGAEQIFGYKADEILGKSVKAIVPPEKEPEFLRFMEDIRKGQSIDHLETVRVRKDGKKIQVSLSVAPIKDAAGQVKAIATIGYDNTDRKMLEAKRLQSDKMESMGQLAGGIAHDFNNVLASIMGYTRLVLQDLPVESPVREDLEQVMSAGQRGKELVDQILAFSRRSKDTVARAPHSLAELVRSTLKFLRPTIPSTIEIQVALLDDLPPVFVDSTKIHQVLVNLCVNACHAMQNKGRLTLSIEDTRNGSHRADLNIKPSDTGSDSADSHVLLIVQDTGCGMDEETLKRIFEPFFTTKKKGEGTGMGLAMVYGIIQDHGGHIHVESELGKGTTFQVYLPVVTTKKSNA